MVSNEMMKLARHSNELFNYMSEDSLKRQELKYVQKRIQVEAEDGNYDCALDFELYPETCKWLSDQGFELIRQFDTVTIVWGKRYTYKK